MQREYILFITLENAGKLLSGNSHEIIDEVARSIGDTVSKVYQCEDCTGCPFAEQCKKTDKNRTVRINRELTSMHREVVSNLESIYGALLRMNRSIQAEGTFGIMENDR